MSPSPGICNAIWSRRWASPSIASPRLAMASIPSASIPGSRCPTWGCPRTSFARESCALGRSADCRRSRIRPRWWRPPPALPERLRVILVGDGPLRRALTEQVHSSGIDDIVFFTGASDRVADWLHALDVFVLPSLNEGISNTLLEAMACGLPALATPVGGNAELLDDGVSGRFFEPGRVEALAGLVRRYLD